MNLTIQLTDEQVERLAADILRLHEPDAPSPLPDPPKPSPLAGLVSPMGCHNVIMGPLKVNAVNESQEEDIAQLCGDGEWRFGAIGFMSTPYALRIGSEIAQLNGLEPEAIPADKEPVPVKRREWEAKISREDGMIIECQDPRYFTTVRVREVLPGDPTPEQVEELADAANEFAFGIETKERLIRLQSALAPFQKH